MKYFCAKCQKRQDVGDIAADLFEICSDKIRDNLDEVFGIDAKTADEKRVILLYRLKKFCRDVDLAPKYFSIKGSEVEKYVKNPIKNQLTISGNLQFSLEWLLRAFVDSGAHQKYKEEDDMECEDPLEISTELSTKNVYDEEIIFYFGEMNGERVLDHITDKNRDPFSKIVGATTDNIAIEEKRGYKRVCPYCGKSLARAVGRAQEVVIALAGSPRAGKTSCMAAAASNLSSGKYSPYGLSMEVFNNDSQWEEFKNELESYKKGLKVTKTPLDAKASSFSILVNVGKRKRVLTFVDMPGEFWQSGSGLSSDFYKNYSGIYLNIDCIWFFMSKLTAYGYDLGSMGNRTEEQERIADISSDDTNIISAGRGESLNANLSTLADFMKSYGREIPPTAVIITKTEIDLNDVDNMKNYALFPVDNGQISKDVESRNANEIKALLLPDKKGGYKINEKEFFEKGLKVRNFLKNATEGIYDAFENNCSYRFYIASANYGHKAADMTDQEKAIPPTPYHDMFPVLWTLAITRAIPVEHLCSWGKKNIFGVVKDRVEGSIQHLFDARNYSEAKITEEKLSQQQIDSREVDKDVAANLLMENIVMNRLNYKQTDFDHGQE